MGICQLESAKRYWRVSSFHIFPFSKWDSKSSHLKTAQITVEIKNSLHDFIKTYGDEGFGIALRLRAKGSVENFAQKWRGAPGRVIGVCGLIFVSFWPDDNEIISIMNMILVEDKEVRSWAWGFDLPSVWHCGTPRRRGHPQVEVERSEGNARWQAAAKRCVTDQWMPQRNT